MSDPEDPKAAQKVNIECLAGCGFLLFGLGLFCLVPGCILMASFATSSEMSATQIGTYVLFSLGNCLLLMGMFITIYWCRASGYHKLGKTDDDQDDDKSTKRDDDGDKGKGKDKKGGNDDNKDKGKGKGKENSTQNGAVSASLDMRMYGYQYSGGSDGTTGYDTKYTTWGTPASDGSSVATCSSDQRYQYDNPSLRREMEAEC